MLLVANERSRDADFQGIQNSIADLAARLGTSSSKKKKCTGRAMGKSFSRRVEELVRGSQ